VKHMNACPLKLKKKEDILKNPMYICEEKLKGIRAFLTFTHLGCILQSRGGHYISFRFPHLSEIRIPELEGVTIDGELFQRGIPDEVIAGWGNHRTCNISPSVTQGVKFMAFDVYNLTLRQFERKQALAGIAPFFKNTMIEVLPYLPVRHAEKMFNNILADGGEGIMLKNLTSMYQPGKRLEGIWYKLKGDEDFDVVITGFEEAKETSIKKGEVYATDTKFKGLIGSFKYGMYTENPHGDRTLIELGTCSGMKDDIRRHMTLHPDHWIGQVVEIKGVAQEKSGAIENPRYIRLRTDKRKEECVWVR